MHSLSLRIINTLNLYRRRRHPLAQHPVYGRAEASRRAKERRKIRRRRVIGVIVIPGVLFFLYRITGAIHPLQLVCISGPILALYAFMPMWALPLGTAISPAIVNERERDTWDLVRITTLDDDMLLLAKMRHGFHALKDMLDVMLLMLILFAAVIGLGFATSILIALGIRNVEVAVLLASVGGLIFFMDRIQQLACMGVAAAAVGSLNSTGRAATFSGGLAALLLSLMEVNSGRIVVFHFI